MLKNKYLISGYYIDDKYEESITYSIVALSENQAKFFLGKKLNCYFAKSLKQGWAMSYKISNNIFIITDLYVYESNISDECVIGDIELLL